MQDEDYGYLAERLVVEQTLARTTSCCAAAAAHQGMANAYRERLQFLILSPAIYKAERSSASCQEWLIAEPTIDKCNTHPTMRGTSSRRGDSV